MYIYHVTLTSLTWHIYRVVKCSQSLTMLNRYSSSIEPLKVTIYSALPQICAIWGLIARTYIRDGISNHICMNGLNADILLYALFEIKYVQT